MYYFMKQPPPSKEICGTCRHGGKIIGYTTYGKDREIKLRCEYWDKEVDMFDLCEKYKSESGPD